MLSDIFENFRNKCIEIYEHDPAHFFICTWISMTSFLKNAEVQLELFTDNVLLMMVEKALEMEYVMQHIDMQKQIISI